MPRREDLYLADIGEASSKLSPEFKEAHPEIPCAKAVGLRNVLAHEYFGTDLSIVWETVTQRVPELRRHLAAIRRES